MRAFLLVITALIWGVAFVAQSKGGKSVGPYAFNFIRMIIGSAVLLPVTLLLDKLKLTKKKPQTKEEKKTLWKAGICCGILLSAASMLQQFGINLGSNVGKAGFLTACYILFVPIIGIALKKKCGIKVWIAVAIALVGLYLLCVKGEFRLEMSDVLLLLCAVVFSLHIITVDHFSPKVDGVRLSCIQFLVGGIICAVPTFIFDLNNADAFDVLKTFDVWIPILYAGVMSCGVAYTLQIIGQNGVNPTIASLLMSLESVFSVLAGFLILGEKMTVKEIVGCVVIFAAICLAQLPDRILGGKDNGRT